MIYSIIYKIKNKTLQTRKNAVIQKYTEVPHLICLLFPFHIHRKILEKVVAEDGGYAAQQGRVNTLTLEYVVNVLAVAVQLTGEPGHRTFLTTQLLLNFPSYVQHGGIYYIR